MIVMNPDEPADPFMPFTNVPLMEALGQLATALLRWQEIAEADDQPLDRFEAVGAMVLRKLQAAAKAASATAADEEGSR